MKPENEIVVAMLVSLICGIVIGACGHILYKDYVSQKTVDGLWIPADNLTKYEALELAYTASVGNWICVNIEDMKLKDMENIIRHEIAHEMFARNCESDWDKCKEVMEFGSQ